MAVDPTQITSHAEVVGSDGQHVGTIDHIGILMTKSDPTSGGVHHFIKMEQVASVTDGKVVLSIPSSEAIDEEMVVEAKG